MKKSVEKYHLPQNWIKTTVEEISLKIHYGFTATTTDIDTGVKYLRITDITESGVKWSNVPFCKIPSEDIGKYELEENDLVFARTGGTVGKSYLIRIDVPKKAVFASYLIRIKPSKHINAKFLGYFFQSSTYWQYIEANKTGLKTNVNAKILSRISIHLPPRKEQDRIVLKLEELISELEKSKDELHVSLEKLKIYRESILRNAFEGKLTEDWRAKQIELKSPAQFIDEIRKHQASQYQEQLQHYLTGKIKVRPTEPKKLLLPDKEEVKSLAFLPKGWVYFPLTYLVENVSIKIIPDKSSKLKFVGMDCIEPHSMHPFQFHEFSEFKSAGNYFQKDQILYGRMRPYLNKVWKANIDGACSGEFFVLKCSPSLTPDFLKYKLHSSTFVAYATHKTSGDRPRISYDEFSNYRFPLCSIEEQHEILRIVDQQMSNIDKTESTINESLKNIESLRATLLQQAFDGKLVEQNPSDEHSIQILELIKAERELFLKKEDEKKDSIKNMKAKKSKKEPLLPLKEIIFQSFARRKFSFDDLRKTTEMSYDDLKEELFKILDEGKVLEVEFDKTSEKIKYKYIGK